MIAELDPRQLEAIQKMHNGCILCAGVGTGKSRTALAYYYKCCGGDLYGRDPFMRGPVKKLYIITTAHKRDTYEWELEFPWFSLSTDPELTPYPSVVVDSWNNIGKYVDVKDAFFIFDEQRVVGYGAWTKAFLKITRFSEWILLSATPGDKWIDYLPVFLANGFYRTKTEFTVNHVVWAPYVKFPKILRYTNEARLLKLRREILVDMTFDRDTEQHHEYVYTDYDKALYKHMAEDRWNVYKGAPFTSASELCYALRQVCNSDISRQTAVLEVVEQHDKVIIFYNFKYERDILMGLNYGDGYTIAEWNGQKHEPIPETNKWVYLVQYTAGAEGWNCVTTDTMIFYSENYSYRIMVQAQGRIDRRTTPFKHLYYYHFTTHSISDAAIAAALKRKKKFNESAFVEKMGWYKDAPIPQADPAEIFAKKYSRAA